MGFIWHIQKRSTISYIQHISTCIQTISYTYQHQHLHLWLPTCYTFLYLCIVKHGSHSQLSWSVPYLWVVYLSLLECSVLPLILLTKAWFGEGKNRKRNKRENSFHFFFSYIIALLDLQVLLWYCLVNQTITYVAHNVLKYGTWFGHLTVARYISLPPISRYHSLDPTNHDISRVHCTCTWQRPLYLLPWLEFSRHRKHGMALYFVFVCARWSFALHCWGPVWLESSGTWSPSCSATTCQWWQPVLGAATAVCAHGSVFGTGTQWVAAAAAAGAPGQHVHDMINMASAMQRIKSPMFPQLGQPFQSFPTETPRCRGTPWGLPRFPAPVKVQTAAHVTSVHPVPPRLLAQSFQEQVVSLLLISHISRHIRHQLLPVPVASHDILLTLSLVCHFWLHPLMLHFWPPSLGRLDTSRLQDNR